MLGFYNEYLKRICYPQELGYWGTLCLIYEFPNKVKMYLFTTAGGRGQYLAFLYRLYNEDGEEIILRDKDVVYWKEHILIPGSQASVESCNKQLDYLFNRILKIGTDEEPMEVFKPQFNDDDNYKLENIDKLFNR